MSTLNDSQFKDVTSLRHGDVIHYTPHDGGDPVTTMVTKPRHVNHGGDIGPSLFFDRSGSSNGRDTYTLNDQRFTGGYIDAEKTPRVMVGDPTNLSLNHALSGAPYSADQKRAYVDKVQSAKWSGNPKK